jgi:Bacterial archaeo-eukaryotic release factor family 2
VKLGFFRPLYTQIGNYVSVYLDTARDHENAPQEVALRWRAARQELAEAGAGEDALDAIEAVVTDPARAAPGRAVFARDGAVTFTASLGSPPRRQIARLGELPHLMPLLAQRPPAAPHLRVVASRGGGEIVAVDGDGEAVEDDRVSRRDWPLHKSPSGGWSQSHHQRNAEEAWEENAKELAASVVEASERIRAEHIVLAGDVRARTLVLEHLPAELQSKTALVEEEVPPDSPMMAEAAGHSVATRAERESRARFGEWQTRRAHGGAVEGLADTLAALRDSRVADLFVADRPTSTATVWIGPGGADLAVTEEELREWGVAEPITERADAAIVRALVATDAELHFLPEDLVIAAEGDQPGIASPRDGICATLRWPEPASAEEGG